MNLTIREIAEACGGKLTGGNAAEYDKCVSSVVIDSRKVEAGGVFLATIGERVDGHKFISQAFSAGAVLAVSQKTPEQLAVETGTEGMNRGCYCVVEDTLQALKDIAEFYRRKVGIPVVGITGSVGKTSTKEFIAGVLAEKYRVLKTEGNYNNEIGVPLTLLRIRPEHQVAVVMDLFDMLADRDPLLFVDPAMADHGRLYTGFGSEFPAMMAQVVSRAHITVPNITEACLMTGMEFREIYDEDYIRTLLQRVAELGAKKIVLTGVSFEQDAIGFMSYDSDTNTYDSYFNHREPHAYHGTGDIFSATAVGGIMRGLSLHEAFRLAVDFTLQCIRETRKDPQAPWYGVEFERALPLLTAQIREFAD